MRFVPNQELDKKSWDLLINNSLQGNVYALSWYLDIVWPGWSAFVLEENSKYKCVVPLPVRTKFGVPILCQPLFSQQLGIYSDFELSYNELDTIADEIAHRFKYIPGYAFNCQNRLKDSKSLVQKSNIILPLDSAYEVLHSNYRRDRKSRLKQALENNIQIIRDNRIEELIDMFKESVEDRIFGGVSVSSYEKLKSIFHEASNRNMANLMYALKDEEIIAGALFLKYRDRITYLFNASYSKSRNLNGRTLILDDVIRHNENRNIVLDFESPESEGISSFYKSFGAHDEQYFLLSQNKLPRFVKVLQKFRQKTIRLLRY